jgi:hypothetical protein
MRIHEAALQRKLRAWWPSSVTDKHLKKVLLAHIADHEFVLDALMVRRLVCTECDMKTIIALIDVALNGV